VPISVGIAILRYRLYEIDQIINRTLVYGLLTVILGLSYAAGSLVFVLVAGTGTNPPSWLVAAATLAAAAIFRPARRGIQTTVDRRFNRRKYNAAQTIQAFSTRLRDQVDLDTSPASCWRSSTRPWSRPKPRCGFDLPHPAPRAQLPVRHGRLPGPTEHHRRSLPLGCSNVKHLGDGPLVPYQTTFALLLR
jgi:hypothetical protein